MLDFRCNVHREVNRTRQQTMRFIRKPLGCSFTGGRGGMEALVQLSDLQKQLEKWKPARWC